jgi:uncharacterized protein (TIGR03435 family)
MRPTVSFVASILVNVTLTTALALLVTWLARKSRAALRHVVLATTFAALLMLPVVSSVLPSVRIVVPIAAADIDERVLTMFAVSDAGSSPIAPAAVNGGATRPVPQSALSPYTALLAGWALVAALFLVPVAVGLWQIRSLRRSGLPWTQGESVVRPLARAAGIRRPVELLLHESITGPMTCGLVHPTIVLPADALQWPPDDLTRAIVHELAHVRRADWAIQCVTRVISACYWFHPLVWIARQKLLLEAERSCDDAVLQTAEATAYASQLVGLAQRLSAAKSQPVLAMANRADLVTRVRAVLDDRQARGRAGATAMVLAGAVAALLVAMLSPVRMAARQTSSQPAAASRQKFDVVSIKPCERPPVVPGGRIGGAYFDASPGRLTVTCMSVEMLIQLAYVRNGEPLLNDDSGMRLNPRPGEPARISGGPDWVRSDRWTIEAKAEGAPEQRVMTGPMLQVLLDERFQLKFHREIKDGIPMYALTVAKGGLKVTPIGPGPDDGCTRLGPTDRGPGMDEEIAMMRRGEKPICGHGVMGGKIGDLNALALGRQTMAGVAMIISGQMDRHVLDKTGVEGRFNLYLEYAADEHARDIDTSTFATGGAMVPGPSIITALERQWGLKLEPTKGPKGVIVIDSVSKPKPNGP